MIARAQRLFKAAPPVEDHFGETPLSGRIIAMINNYLANELAVFDPDQGEERAKRYKKIIFDAEYENTNPDEPTKDKYVKRRAPADRPEDYHLVMQVYRDVVAGYGTGALGSSKKLRNHLLELLCKHLNVKELEMYIKMAEACNEMIVMGMGIGAGSEALLMKVGMRVAEEYLLAGLYDSGYATRPAYHPEPGAIEMQIIHSRSCTTRYV